MLNLDLVNAWSEAEARTAFLRCCGATRWAQRMAALRPFASAADLFAAAANVWQALGPEDWQAAFAAHSRIGDLESLRTQFASTAALAAGEQAGVAGAPEATLLALAEGNRAYEARFGHLFLVCATGKTAAEMLAMLRQRLHNSPEQELVIAAAEQEKITRLRLQRLGS